MTQTRRPARSCLSKTFASAKLNLLRAIRSREGADYLAGGLALGAFWLWTPIWIGHFPAAFITAQWARVSKLAALSMVLVSNPATVIPLQITNAAVGVWLTPGGNPGSALRNPRLLLESPLDFFLSIKLHDFFTLCLGSCVTGTVTSLVVWAVARRWAWGVQRRRQRKHAAVIL